MKKITFNIIWGSNGLVAWKLHNIKRYMLIEAVTQFLQFFTHLLPFDLKLFAFSLFHCALMMPYGSMDLDQNTQVMAWCLMAPSHYLNQCWPSSMIPYDISKGQPVNSQYDEVTKTHKVNNFDGYITAHAGQLSIFSPFSMLSPSNDSSSTSSSVPQLSCWITGAALWLQA